MTAPRWSDLLTSAEGAQLIHDNSEVTASGCWEWRRGRTSKGYGAAHVKAGGVRLQVVAHRLAYESFVGPILKGLVIDHLCRNRGCVNPDHLEPVTIGENIRRGERSTILVFGTCRSGKHRNLGSADQWAGRRGCKHCQNESRRVRKQAAKCA